MIKNHLSGLMYSPLPRSAQHPLSTEVKRGVTPFFGLPEKSLSREAGGMGGLVHARQMQIFSLFFSFLIVTKIIKNLSLRTVNPNTQ
jgi:hypothetical protein